MVHVVSCRPLWINNVFRNKNPKTKWSHKTMPLIERGVNTETRFSIWQIIYRSVSGRCPAPHRLYFSKLQSSRLLGLVELEDSQNKISAHKVRHITFVANICFASNYNYNTQRHAGNWVNWHLKAVEFVITEYSVVVLVGDVKYSAQRSDTQWF